MERYILEAMNYFPVKEWTKLDGSEQLNYGSVLYVYKACLYLGIQVEIPDFMLKHEIESNLQVKKRKYCKLPQNNKNKKAKTENSVDSNEEKKKFLCTQCNYTTFHLKHLKQHQMIHRTDKRFDCAYCEKSFKHKGDLQKHIKYVHLKVGTMFECEKCGYKTNHKSHLNRHMSVHSDVKRFICEICSKGFNRKEHFNRHLLKHSQEKCKCSHS